MSSPRAHPCGPGRTTEPAAWRINGQKMWTTLAQEAGYVLLLTRTDPDRRNISACTMFLVPLDTPGITIQAIHTIVGRAHQRRVLRRRAGPRRLPDRRGRRGRPGDGDSRSASSAASWAAPAARAAGQAASAGRASRMRTAVRPADDPAVLEAIGQGRIDAEVAVPAHPAHGVVGAAGAVAGARRQHGQALRDDCLPACCALRSGGVLPGRDRRVGASEGGEFERAVRHSAVTTIQGGTTEIARNYVAEL